MKKNEMTIAIGNKAIGVDKPVFIIAEAGVNFNGSLKIAKQLIDAAASAKADAVKFQTFDPRTLVTRTGAKAEYQTRNIGDESHWQMLEKLKLNRAYHQRLKEYAEGKGLIFLSTPFSIDDADFLHELGVLAIKVGSTDTNNIPYLQHIAKWDLPIILSTGMSDLEEVRESVNALKKAGARKIVVLHCTTNYPTPYDEANLKAMLTLKEELGLITGYSDHTMGIEAPIAAVAMGAKVIEKHFTLDRNMPGPDHLASIEPDELKQMVTSIRNIEKSLGSGKKTPFKSEQKIAEIARKSVVAARFVPAGKKLTADDLILKRPGTGIKPKFWNKVLTKKAKRDIKEEELISWTMLK
jgi:N,N'-diacetyllegionaminate synthase